MTSGNKDNCVFFGGYMPLPWRALQDDLVEVAEEGGGQPTLEETKEELKGPTESRQRRTPKP
jgi:hypothetical protein